MKVDEEKARDALKKSVQDSPLVKDILGPIPKTPDEIWRKMGLLIK